MGADELPDRTGRTLLLAIAIWTAVGLAAFAALTFAFPRPRPPLAGAVAGCKSTVPSGVYDPANDNDPARPIALARSSCAGPGVATTELLHAYLEGAELDSAPRRPAPPIDAALRTRGAALYASHCATCHGATGDGAGPDACALQPAAAVHTRGVFALRTTEHEALPTDEDLFRTITRGIHGTAMPPWFALPEHDRWALVAHLKTLSKQFDEDVAPPPVVSGPQPEATPVRLAAGQALYTTGGCASCHGATGHGNGAAAEALPVRPRDFTLGRFHRGSTVADIHETLVTGLDGTPMASFVTVMTVDEMWNVSLYVHGLVPPMVEHERQRCPTTGKPFDTQELFGVRNLMKTLAP